MTTPDPRERAIEAMLRRPAPHDAAAGECLDAEVLAAWVDDDLDEPTREQAEAHVSGCARCQAVMATLVASAPDAAEGPAVPSTSWWRFDIRWLVPLAGAATAALLWVVIPERAPDQVARLEDRVRPEETVVAPFRAPERVAPQPVPPVEPAQRTERFEKPGARDDAAAPPLAGEPDRAAKQEAVDARANELGRRDAAREGEKKAAASSVIAGATAAAPPPSAPAAPPAPAAAPPSAETAVRQRAPFEARSELLGAVAGGIVSRDPAVRWRVAGPGIVERSSNAGASWDRLDTGSAAPIVAGSAPSATVCWVVGGSGAVLLTTDARTWRSLPAPTSDDLVAVDAVSERSATVRTAAGDSFRTTDAGTTWTRLP